MELNALVNLTLRCTSMRIATIPDIVLRSSWTVGELLLRDMLAGFFLLGRFELLFHVHIYGFIRW